MQSNKNKIGIIGLRAVGHPLAVEFDKKISWLKFILKLQK
jgi:UDP-N-acetyl-D-mannosaminuronate dehydrogenase